MPWNIFSVAEAQGLVVIPYEECAAPGLMQPTLVSLGGLFLKLESLLE